MVNTASQVDNFLRTMLMYHGARVMYSIVSV